MSATDHLTQIIRDGLRAQLQLDEPSSVTTTTSNLNESSLNSSGPAQTGDTQEGGHPNRTLVPLKLMRTGIGRRLTSLPDEEP